MNETRFHSLIECVSIIFYYFTFFYDFMIIIIVGSYKYNTNNTQISYKGKKNQSKYEWVWPPTLCVFCHEELSERDVYWFLLWLNLYYFLYRCLLSLVIIRRRKDGSQSTWLAMRIEENLIKVESTLVLNMVFKSKHP